MSSERLALSVLESVSLWEREYRAERTSVARRLKAAKRELGGGQTPYGYRLAEDGVHLEEHPREKQAVDLALNFHGKGHSLRAIGRLLARHGFRPRSRGEWQAATIQRIVGRRGAIA